MRVIITLSFVLILAGLSGFALSNTGSEARTQKVKLSSTSRVFKSARNEYFIIKDLLGPYFFSSDGKKFYTFVYDGFAGSDDEFEMTIENPHKNFETKEATLKNGILTIDGTVYRETSKRSSIDAVPLPHIRIPGWLYASADGKYFYVSGDKYYLNQIRFFTGKGNSLKRVAHSVFENCRCGDSIVVVTKLGTLSDSGRHGEPGEFPAWGKLRLRQVNPRDYRIVEKGNTVTISKR